MRHRCTAADVLRAAIEGDPRSGEEIARAAGTSASMVSRLMNHHRMPRLDLAERLARVLGLRLVIETERHVERTNSQAAGGPAGNGRRLQRPRAGGLVR